MHRQPALGREDEISIRFGVLYRRYGELLQRYMLGLARRRDVAEDLCQQLWLRLYEAALAGRFVPEDEASFRSYLFTAGRNLHLDECVRRHSVSRTATVDPHVLEGLVQASVNEPGSPVEAALDDEERRRRVRRAIGALPPAQRDTLELWLGETSIVGMARATAAPRDTVLSRKKYAMRRLRSSLADLRPG